MTLTSSAAGVNDGAVRFNGNEPCPVCQSGSKGCNRQASGLIFCRGREAAKGERVGEFACVGKDRNDTFWLFKVHEERGAAREGVRGLRPSNGRPGQPEQPSLIDWDRRLGESQKRLTDERKEALAQALGVPLA